MDLFKDQNFLHIYHDIRKSERILARYTNSHKQINKHIKTHLPRSLRNTDFTAYVHKYMKSQERNRGERNYP